MIETSRLYGIMAEFDSQEAAIAAVETVHREGYRCIEAYSPYPVPELADALHFHRTYVPVIVLLGALLGGCGGYFMQYYFNAISYPINVGGRPLNSWPAFVPVTFELTILSAVLCAFIGMFALNRLPMLYHPVWNVARFTLATRDRFFVCIQARDPRFNPTLTRQFLATLDPNPEEVADVPAYASDDVG